VQFTSAAGATYLYKQKSKCFQLRLRRAAAGGEGEQERHVPRDNFSDAAPTELYF
jgi:hypothetical protein